MTHQEEAQRAQQVLSCKGMEPQVGARTRCIDAGTELLIRSIYDEVSPSEKVIVKKWAEDDEFVALAIIGIEAYRNEHLLNSPSAHIKLLEKELQQSLRY